MREVLSGTAVYLSSDAFNSLLPSGKTWLSIDYASAAKKLGLDLGSVAAQSPGNTLQQLEHSGHVIKVGSETIDGVATTHYTATLGENYARKIANLANGTVSIQPVDVWIDGSGLVRRVHLAYDANSSSTGSLSNDTTIDLSNYGEKVDVNVPSSADTYDATSMIGGTP